MNNKLLFSILYLSFSRVSSLISDLKYVPGSHGNNETVEISDFSP